MRFHFTYRACTLLLAIAPLVGCTPAMLVELLSLSDPVVLEELIFGLSDARPRLAATPCRSAACDRTQWTVIKIFSAAASRIWPEEAGFSYFFDFIPTRPDGWQPADPVVSGSVRAADQRLALVTEAGRLILADFGRTDALAEMHLAAVGVSWNNAGDRLGVAVRSTIPPHYRLQILTPEFDPLREFEVELPLPGPDAIDWRLVVSWNSDDTLIAVSTDAPRAGELEPQAVLLDLQTDRATVAAISSVFFIGRSSFVGIDEPRPAQLSGLAGRGRRWAPSGPCAQVRAGGHGLCRTTSPHKRDQRSRCGVGFAALHPPRSPTGRVLRCFAASSMPPCGRRRSAVLP